MNVYKINTSLFENDTIQFRFKNATIMRIRAVILYTVELHWVIKNREQRKEFRNHSLNSHFVNSFTLENFLFYC